MNSLHWPQSVLSPFSAMHIMNTYSRTFCISKYAQWGSLARCACDQHVGYWMENLTHVNRLQSSSAGESPIRSKNFESAILATDSSTTKLRLKVMIVNHCHRYSQPWFMQTDFCVCWFKIIFLSVFHYLHSRQYFTFWENYYVMKTIMQAPLP